MPSTNTRVTVRTAERPRPDRPSEDRIFTTTNAVIVLDGASQPDGGGHRDGGWLADTLGREIQRRLTDGPDDLTKIAARSIATVADRYQLTPGSGPSTTVSIVRWNGNEVEALVLGDSPVVALTRDGGIHQLRDDRLHRVGVHQRRRLHTEGGSDEERQAIWRDLVHAERSHRNQPGGYWIAEADPDAGRHAFRAQWHRDDLAAVLVMTDGVSAGVDRYGTPADWHTAITIARADPEQLVALVHDAEDTDADCTRWPRSKRYDDKALAVIEFATV